MEEENKCMHQPVLYWSIEWVSRAYFSNRRESNQSYSGISWFHHIKTFSLVNMTLNRWRGHIWIKIVIWFIHLDLALRSTTMRFEPTKSVCTLWKKKQKIMCQGRPRWDSNPQSSDPKSDALSVRPRGLDRGSNSNKTSYNSELPQLRLWYSCFLSIGNMLGVFLQPSTTYQTKVGPWHLTLP